ncbi:protein trafficking Pga2, partial [Pyrenochaeta sp. MPI-SDFR-AT-0127]
MDYILDNVGEWKDRLVNNSVKSFTEMTPQRWIRIIVIVGAYLLIRPYLLNAAANRQKKQMEKEAEELGLERSTEPNANDFRGGKKSSK